MNKKIILILLVIICVISSRRPALADQQFVISDKPVKITASELKDSEPNEGLFHLELLIEYGAERYKFSTLLFLQNSNIKKAIEYQKKRTRWNGPYLLVGWERGGGNASRGFLDAVFTIKQGHLLYLGEVAADSFEKGVFKDWYDKFETNELTSHAEAPGARLVLEAKGNRLVVNLEKTWTENQKRFIENKDIIKHIQSKEKRNSSERASQLSGPLLFNAVVSKYCKHDREATIFVDTAKKELDKESLRLFKGILSNVNPGELPIPAIDIKKN